MIASKGDNGVNQMWIRAMELKLVEKDAEIARLRAENKRLEVLSCSSCHGTGVMWAHDGTETSCRWGCTPPSAQGTLGQTLENALDTFCSCDGGFVSSGGPRGTPHCTSCNKPVRSPLSPIRTNEQEKS